MRLFRVRRYDPIEDSIQLVVVTFENILKDPTAFNMADVGLVLLNLEREKYGLSLLSEKAVADYAENCGVEVK